MILPLQLSRAGEPIEGSLAAVFERDLDRMLSERAAFLGPSELAYLETLRFPLRRNSYVLGRYAAKEALRACFNDSDAGAFEVGKGVFEQPVVAGSNGRFAEVSIAHSSGVAVALACRAGHPVGIDLEFIGGGNSDFLASSQTALEASLLASRFPENTRRYFLWTMKEALSKALRCGLMTSWNVLELAAIEEGPDESWLGEFTHFPQYKVHAWVLANYALSMVLPKKTELRISIGPLSQHLAPLSAANS